MRTAMQTTWVHGVARGDDSLIAEVMIKGTMKTTPWVHGLARGDDSLIAANMMKKKRNDDNNLNDSVISSVSAECTHLFVCSERWTTYCSTSFPYLILGLFGLAVDRTTRLCFC